MARTDQPPQPGTGTHLFDLDGVITRRDTFSLVVTRRLARLPHLVPLAVPALALVASPLPWLRGRGVRHLVRAALLGASLEEVRASCAEVGAEFARTPSWLHLDAVALLREHLRHGERVVVVTATETTLARALLDGLDLGGATVLGSTLAATRSGVVLHPHNYGARKVVSLREAGVPEPWLRFHTDSTADLPLLGHVDDVVLVNPSPTLVRAASRLSPRPSSVRRVRWS